MYDTNVPKLFPAGFILSADITWENLFCGYFSFGMFPMQRMRELNRIIKNQITNLIMRLNHQNDSSTLIKCFKDNCTTIHYYALYTQLNLQLVVLSIC